MKNKVTILTLILSLLIASNSIANKSDTALLESVRKEYYEGQKSSGRTKNTESNTRETYSEYEEEEVYQKSSAAVLDYSEYYSDTNWIHMDIYEPEPQTPLEKTEKELKDMRRKLNFYNRVIRSVEREEAELARMKAAAAAAAKQKAAQKNKK